MIIVRDKNMIELGILENAYNIPAERVVNEVWQSSFSLPKSDPKNVLCTHLNYIEIISPSGRNYGMYRIMPTETSKSSSDESITYKCEHVFSTLIDDVIDGYMQLTGYNTTQALQAILNLQEVKRWVLGQVDFNYTYEYAFENENGLLAPLLSIPKAFNEPYEFTFDTTVYPWVLNLVKPSNVIKSEIRWGKDMRDFNEVSDPTDIVNYIIPKGSGEGINQLTIAKVNGGLKYLKNDASITQWGKRSYIWIDKSIDDPYTLKARAQAILDEKKCPKISFEINSVDLSVLPEYEHERKSLNGITRILVDDKEYYARIIGEKISDITSEYDVVYQISNKINNIATTQANLERKIQVTQAYSQGATSVMTFSYQENCDSAHPAIIPVFIDEDVRNVNTCELTFSTKKYRGYTFTAATSTGTYDVVNNEVTIPGHNHMSTLGVLEFETMPAAIMVKVDGVPIPGNDLNRERINLVDYLSRSNEVITRGRHEITIMPIGEPNGVARIEAYVILRVFIQSRLGGVY